ncbi:DNA-3-methyladenine glycosylase I [Acidobacteriota bacterium]
MKIETKNLNIAEDKFIVIDEIINCVTPFRNEEFQGEYTKRTERNPESIRNDSDYLRICAELIAYSQNARAEKVSRILSKGLLKKVFEEFEIENVASMNPCDLADKYWKDISAIRQQAKLFHIVSVARKMRLIKEEAGSFRNYLNSFEIPIRNSNSDDIDRFWIAFKQLRKKMEEYKFPFFRSTTSLLHLLLHLGYDCIKPDTIIMNVAERNNIIESSKRNINLVPFVYFIQRYSISRNIRPSIVDLYLLIYGGQSAAKEYVTDEFYLIGKKISSE